MEDSNSTVTTQIRDYVRKTKERRASGRNNAKITGWSGAVGCV
jgi:hypothetical protein